MVKLKKKSKEVITFEVTTTKSNFCCWEDKALVIGCTFPQLTETQHITYDAIVLRH